MTRDSESDGEDPAVTHRRRVREGYDELAADYAENRDPDPDEVALVETVVDRIEERRPRVLDAGCGDGRAASVPLTAAGARAIGLDVSRSQLRLARDAVDGVEPEPGLLQGDLTALPFETGAFDGICALHSIIHVPRDEHAAVLAEFARVLDAGGWLLVTVGADGWEGENEDWLDSGAAMRWSFHGAEWTRETLEDAGFAVDETRTIDDELSDGAWRYILAQRT